MRPNSRFQNGSVLMNGTTSTIPTTLTANDVFKTGNGFTMWRYVKLKSLGESSNGRIYDKGGATGSPEGFAYFVNTSNIVTLVINGGTSRSSAANSLKLNTWQLVLVTAAADGTVTHYINAVQSGTPGTTGALSGITTENPLTIGNRSTFTDRTFDGNLGEGGICPRVLTQAEINALYAEGTIPAGTAHHWALDECTGEFVDSIGGKPGTGANTSYSTDVPMQQRIKPKNLTASLQFLSATDRVAFPQSVSLRIYEFEKVAESPDLEDAHQGVTTDGTYYYIFHTSYIAKYDLQWNLVQKNSNAQAECGNSHLGDGHYYNGLLYVATDDYVSCANFGVCKISIWNASDLSFVETHDVSAQGHEVSSCVVDGDAGIIYVSSYCDSHFWKYSLADFSFIGSVAYSISLLGVQGIAKKGDYLYVNKDPIYRVALDGTVLDKVYATTNEGIDYNGEGLSRCVR